MLYRTPYNDVVHGRGPVFFGMETEVFYMRESIMRKNYFKAFRRVILLAVLLAVVSAAAITTGTGRSCGKAGSRPLAPPTMRFLAEQRCCGWRWARITGCW